jgi:hypothetical protein
MTLAVSTLAADDARCPTLAVLAPPPGHRARLLPILLAASRAPGIPAVPTVQAALLAGVAGMQGAMDGCGSST